MIGKTLGHYEIIGLLGKGGMGEVYRARDSKLDRGVAIKVLPESLAHDKLLLARFDREAKLLATFNHQNIAGIHELGVDEGIHFLVMELVEGPGLDERLNSGKMQMDEILTLFGQLAEALEFAHERGVIHRDLKPANIKISNDGLVKILDFGLAKALDTNADSSSPEDDTIDLGLASTVLETADGRILGTPAYMSPEQACGRVVDKRTDIWAYGCCLYEALTQERPFQGSTAVNALAEIVKSDPDWELIPQDTPAHVRVLVWRCLQKDPQRRLRDIGEARLELSGESTHPDGIVPSFGDMYATGFSRKTITIVAVLSLVFGSIIAGVLTRSFFMPTTEVATIARPTSRFEIDIGRSEPLRILDISAEVAISPDGRRIAYTANLDGTKRIYVRELDAAESTAVPGTENAWHPFFSPDGEWIAYQVPGSPADRQGRLMKVAIKGGPPLDLCHAFPPAGGTWLENGSIVFTSQDEELDLSNNIFLSHLFSVSENGGAPQRLVKVEPGNQGPLTYVLPKAAIGEDFFLFTMVDHQGVPHASMYDFASQSHEVLLDNALGAQYASSGHLVFVRGEALWAAPFDSDSKNVGNPMVVQPDVQMNKDASAAPFALSSEGSLFYPPVAAVAEGPDRKMIWVDHDGREETIAVPPNKYWWPRVSPDGSRVAMSIQVTGEENEDIWIHHLERAQSITRFTFAPEMDSFPLWSPDSRHLYFASDRRRSGDLFRRRADGTGSVHFIWGGPRFEYPADITHDGADLIYGLPDENDNWNIHELRLPVPGQNASGSLKNRPLLDSEFQEGGTRLSADGKWIAYNTDETTPTQVFVRPYPNVNDGRWQVSTNGGINPSWSADGSEIYYRNGNQMMAVAVQTEPTFRPGKPRVLFAAEYYYAPDLSVQYDLEYPDRERFLLLKELVDTRSTKLVYIGNWVENLRESVPIASP